MTKSGIPSNVGPKFKVAEKDMYDGDCKLSVDKLFKHRYTHANIIDINLTK